MGRVKGPVWISGSRHLLLPVPGARLGITLAVRWAVAGVRVSSSWWRGDSVARGRGVPRAGLVS